jgi:hypothetical protein
MSMIPGDFFRCYLCDEANRQGNCQAERKENNSEILLKSFANGQPKATSSPFHPQIPIPRSRQLERILIVSLAHRHSGLRAAQRLLLRGLSLSKTRREPPPIVLSMADHKFFSKTFPVAQTGWYLLNAAYFIGNFANRKDHAAKNAKRRQLEFTRNFKQKVSRRLIEAVKELINGASQVSGQMSNNATSAR